MTKIASVTPIAATAPARMYTATQTASFVGIHRTTLDRLVRTGRFPAPVYLGEKTPRWPETVVTDFLTSRLAG